MFGVLSSNSIRDHYTSVNAGEGLLHKNSHCLTDGYLFFVKQSLVRTECPDETKVFYLSSKFERAFYERRKPS